MLRDRERRLGYLLLLLLRLLEEKLEERDLFLERLEEGDLPLDRDLWEWLDPDRDLLLPRSSSVAPPPAPAAD